MDISQSRHTTSAVQRAAKTAGKTGAADRGARRFLALVVLLIMAGSTTVGFAWAERQYDHPTLFASWENAYAVFDCHQASWLEPFDSRENPNGIRSRGDGVIYIEPNNESVTGDNAQLGVFLENVGVRLTDQTLTLPDGTTISEQGAQCNGEEAVLQILRWETPLSKSTPDQIATEQLAGTRFLGDKQAFAIALAPLGSTVPPPPSVANLTPRSDGPVS